MDIPFIKQLALKQNMNLSEVSIYIETFVLGFSADLQVNGKASFDPFGFFEVEKELEYIKEEDGCKLLMPPRLKASFCSSAILGVLATDEGQTATPLYELFTERHEWESEAITLFIAQIKSVVKSALLKDKKCTIPGFGTFEGELGGDINFDFFESFEDLINKPFSHFKPVELSCSEKDLKSADNSAVAPIVEPLLSKLEEEKPAESVFSTDMREDLTLQESGSLGVFAVKFEEFDKRILQIEKELRDNNKVINRFKWLILLLVLMIVLFLILTFYMHPSSNDAIIDSVEKVENLQSIPQNNKTFAELEEDYLQQNDMESISLADSIFDATRDTISLTNDLIVPSKDAKPVSTDFIEHNLKSGETLRSLAEKYYNDREEWIRIVKENSDIITDPNHIPVGTTLRIPK